MNRPCQPPSAAFKTPTRRSNAWPELLKCVAHARARTMRTPHPGKTMFSTDTSRLAVVGLGYVGLPLAVAFGRNAPVIGYDIDSTRVDGLREGHDHTLETSTQELAE